MRRDIGQHLGPRQRGPLAWLEQRRFAPDRDMVKAELSLAMDARLLDVHVQAEGTAIELRSANLDQVTDGWLDRIVLQQGAEFQVLLEEFGGLLHGIHALSHVGS
ncbi:hypothetical protein D9M70_640610 [compost metagenome]